MTEGTWCRLLMQRGVRWVQASVSESVQAKSGTSQEAMDETFLLTNIAPQVGDGFNRHCERCTSQRRLGMLMLSSKTGHT